MKPCHFCGREREKGPAESPVSASAATLWSSCEAEAVAGEQGGTACISKTGHLRQLGCLPDIVSFTYRKK